MDKNLLQDAIAGFEAKEFREVTVFAAQSVLGFCEDECNATRLSRPLGP